MSSPNLWYFYLLVRGDFDESSPDATQHRSWNECRYAHVLAGAVLPLAQPDGRVAQGHPAPALASPAHHWGHSFGLLSVPLGRALKVARRNT